MNELERVLTALQDRQVEFRIPAGTERLLVRGQLRSEEAEVLGRHREELTQAIQDREMKQTGRLVCERQVFELAHEVRDGRGVA